MIDVDGVFLKPMTGPHTDRLFKEGQTSAYQITKLIHATMLT